MIASRKNQHFAEITALCRNMFEIYIAGARHFAEFAEKMIFHSPSLAIRHAACEQLKIFLLLFYQSTKPMEMNAGGQDRSRPRRLFS
jgi:hypothetical protein